jgi:elongation factor G
MPEKKNYLTKIRNIGIMAHIDAGKTTTTERILYLCKKIHKMGEVRGKKDDKGATMDYMKQEKERGITIQSAATTVYWKECQINLIDTPGHVDFTAEVERSLRVLDGGIVVIDGKEGVEAQTETVWNQADKYQIPRLVFINKMDSMDSAENVENRFVACCQSLEEKLGAKLVICQFPIGGPQGIEGVVDLVEKKACYFQKGDHSENYQVKEIPVHLQEKVQIYRQNLLEEIALYISEKELGEELGLKFLEGQSVSSQEIKELIRKMVISGRYFAVFCGSAYKHVGINLLLDGVVNYLPSPRDQEQITVFSGEKEEKISTLNCSFSLGLAFKIMNLPFAKLTFVRVYCGKFLPGSYIYNINKGEKERVTRLVRMHADKQEEVSEVKMGDIVAIIGLAHTATGHTLCSEKKEILLEQISFTEPVISLAIEPRTKKEHDLLSKGLKSLSEEDPTFRSDYNSETGQMIISGMGELHLEVLVERLKSEFKVEAKVGKPQVAYREAFKEEFELDPEGNKIRRKIFVNYLHKKQTGGAGQRAEVDIEFEANPDGGELEFVDALKGEGIPEVWRPSVKKGIERALSKGLILGYPIIDVKATLVDGKTHPVDSSPLAFENAGYYAFKENIDKFKIVLQEPIMKLEVSNIPEEYYGTVLASINSKRGVVEGIERKKTTYLLKAKIPLVETFGYSTTLRSLTEGRATHSLQFSHYQEVPSDIMEDLVKSK